MGAGLRCPQFAVVAAAELLHRMRGASALLEMSRDRFAQAVAGFLQGHYREGGLRFYAMPAECRAKGDWGGLAVR